MQKKKRGTEMAQASGAASAISMCKRGSDVMKMRGEKNKTMFGFLGVTACVVKVKTDWACLDL